MEQLTFTDITSLIVELCNIKARMVIYSLPFIESMFSPKGSIFLKCTELLITCFINVIEQVECSIVLLLLSVTDKNNYLYLKL